MNENERNIKRGKNAVINYINSLGFIVCEINDEYYTVTSFEEANSNSWKHVLTGKNITSVVNNFFHIHHLDSTHTQQILQQIEKNSTVKKFFHKDYKFIIHYVKD